MPNYIKNISVTLEASTPENVEWDGDGYVSDFNSIDFEKFCDELNTFVKDQIEAGLEERKIPKEEWEAHVNNVLISVEHDSEVHTLEEDRWSHVSGHHTVDTDTVKDDSIQIDISFKDKTKKTMVKEDIPFLIENITEIDSLSNHDVRMEFESTLLKRRTPKMGM